MNRWGSVQSDDRLRINKPPEGDLGKTRIWAIPYNGGLASWLLSTLLGVWHFATF
jgi:hypothetical protein